MKWHKKHTRAFQKFRPTIFQIWRFGCSPMRAWLPESNHPEFDKKIADLRLLMLAAQAGERSAYKELLTGVSDILHRHYKNRLPTPVIGLAIRNTLLTIHALRHTYDPASSFEPWIYEIATLRGRDACRSEAGAFTALPI